MKRTAIILFSGIAYISGGTPINGGIIYKGDYPVIEFRKKDTDNFNFPMPGFALVKTKVKGIFDKIADFLNLFSNKQLAIQPQPVCWGFLTVS